MSEIRLNIKYLEPIQRTIDIWSNDDLFNLIEEQREKINELIKIISEQRGGE